MGGLRGFVGQRMAGRPKYSNGYAYNFPPGSYTFTAPKAGLWKFVLWGGGGSSTAGTDSGASGAYCEYTRLLGVGASVTLSIGATETATTATFLGGYLVTAGGATNSSAGAASGGDVNLNGTAGLTFGAGTASPAGQGTGGGPGGIINGGSGAPANLPFRGGAGGNPAFVTVAAPGGGAPQAGIFIPGAPGLALVVLARLRI